MLPMRRHSTMSVPMPTISMSPGLLPAYLTHLILAKFASPCTIRNQSPVFPGRFQEKATMPQRTDTDDNDLLGDLTPAQREAATHFEGPLLILAGAGSGKTRVITRRVAWLLRQGVAPWNVLAITFTNKAAGEMRQRVEAIVPDSRVWISTFHSFGARLLRMYADRLGLDRNFT